MTGWSFFYSQYRTEEVDLRGSTFPIIFKICVSPAFDKEALINMGYTKFSHYFQASIIDFCTLSSFSSSSFTCYSFWFLLVWIVLNLKLNQEPVCVEILKMLFHRESQRTTPRWLDGEVTYLMVGWRPVLRKYWTLSLSTSHQRWDCRWIKGNKSIREGRL